MSGIGRRLGYGLVGAFTMKFARSATRRAMYSEAGVARLPAATRRHDGLPTVLAFAAAAGAALAIADLLLEELKDVKRRG